MRIAVVQSAGRQDRVALTVAKALRRHHHDVTLLVPQPELQSSTPPFTHEWRAAGFSCIPLNSARIYPAANHFPRDYRLAAARSVASLAPSFDALWFFERHWAMPTLRDRRFRRKPLPIVVLDAQPDPEHVPRSLEEINLANSRRYAATWADVIVTGELDTEGSVLRLEQLFAQRCSEPPKQVRQPVTNPAVTVCIPYFEAPEFLPQLLESLAQQTSSDFTVVVVDDGSESDESRLALHACTQRYAARGWKFIRQPNRFPGAARNRAAQEAETEFLLFIDSDDVAAPVMVERFLEAALLTGDDCLVAPSYEFREHHEGPCELCYDPPGNSLIGSMADDMHGGPCIFVRRDAFFSIGGFTEIRGIGYEDYEFHVRCNLEGLRWDVLPGLIYHYRMPRSSGVSRSTDNYANGARVRACFEQRLTPLGLGQLPLAFAAAYRDAEQGAASITQLRAAFGRCHKNRLKLLLLTCHFPFEFASGWHNRVCALIRYFGSRYELTLLTPMQRHQINPARREVFRYLHALRGVEPGAEIQAGRNFLLPLRVRQQYRDTFQAAVRTLPTHRFHAAIIDQIFMAEFRHDIDTVCVLNEHNIESRLLWQRALQSQAIATEARRELVQAKIMERYENRQWPAFPVRAVVSEVDAEQMRRRVATGKIVIAPNGADPSIWLPDVKQASHTVLFTGHLAYPPNIDAVEFLASEIWPRVRKKAPGTTLIIAGRSPTERVNACAHTAGAELHAGPQFMHRIARRAALTIVPLRFGSGTRVKILESLAWGLPVVSTTLGCEGLDVIDGEHLLVRDDPAQFADAVVQLLSDTALWQKLRNQGRELIRESYNWERVFEPLEMALLELTS